MRPDIRIFPDAVYTARRFRCYSCIRKTKIGKYTKTCAHKVSKVKLAPVGSVKVSAKTAHLSLPQATFYVSEKVVLMLSLGMGRLSEKKKKNLTF